MRNSYKIVDGHAKVKRRYGRLRHRQEIYGQIRTKSDKNTLLLCETDLTVSRYGTATKQI
jgi:uncharacterized protein (DUF924 family)